MRNRALHLAGVMCICTGILVLYSGDAITQGALLVLVGLLINSIGIAASLRAYRTRRPLPQDTIFRRIARRFPWILLTLILTIVLIMTLFPSGRIICRFKDGCVRHLRSISLAVHYYAQESDGWFPTTGVEGESGESLLLLSETYIKSKALVCPHADRARSKRRSVANSLLSEDQVDYHYVNGFRENAPPNTPICWDKKENHESAGRNVLFADGQVKWFKESDFKALMAVLADAKSVGIPQ